MYEVYSYMTETDLIETIAVKNHVTPEEVRNEIQFMIDDPWANYETDTEEFKKLRLRIGHKPSILEFPDYCAGLVEKERKQERRFFFR